MHRALRLPRLLLIEGRLLQGPRPTEVTAAAKAHQRATGTVRNFLQRGVPGARLTLTIPGEPSQQVTQTDEDGYFAVRLVPLAAASSATTTTTTKPAASSPPKVLLHLEPGAYGLADTQLELQVVPPGPGIAVVSDIDDTLLDTNVRKKVRMVVRALVATPESMQPFPGAAQVMTALATRPYVAAAVGPATATVTPAPERPVFYVSGSPWQLQGRLQAFLAQKTFPTGVLTLKRFFHDPMRDQTAYKVPLLLELVDAMPERQFVVLGDSGESDPEVYARVKQERPGRLAAVLIHLVSKEGPTAPRFAGQFVFTDYADAGKYLVEQHWVDPAASLPSSSNATSTAKPASPATAAPSSSKRPSADASRQRYDPRVSSCANCSIRKGRSAQPSGSVRSACRARAAAYSSASP
jgi:phosphatidate phosphatase APP1